MIGIHNLSRDAMPHSPRAMRFAPLGLVPWERVVAASHTQPGTTARPGNIAPGDKLSAIARAYLHLGSDAIE
jgi:hypothetical protein